MGCVGPVGILVSGVKDLNEFCKVYRVLVHVGRVVHVLKEHISDTMESLIMAVRRMENSLLTATGWGRRSVQQRCQNYSLLEDRLDRQGRTIYRRG